jgi:hypothetical protein
MHQEQVEEIILPKHRQNLRLQKLQRSKTNLILQHKCHNIKMLKGIFFTLINRKLFPLPAFGFNFFRSWKVFPFKVFGIFVNGCDESSNCRKAALR